MPKKDNQVTVNFLSKQSFENSTFGKAVNWALTIGKAIVFTCFAVIMGLFIYRFSLDRKINFLHYTINNNVDEIADYAETENDIRLYQDKLTGLDYLYAQDQNSNQILSAIENRVPIGTVLNNISITKNNIALQGTTKDEFYFVALLNSLKKENIFANINVDEITSGGISDSEIEFSINIQTQKPNEQNK